VKICVVSHSGADLILGINTGGAERQLALVARHLAQRGHDVTMVAPGWPHGPAVAHGVRLLPGWESSGGVRLLRGVTYRLPRFREVLTTIAADCYFTMGVNHYVPVMVRTARRVGAVSMVALASDRDLFHDSGKYNLAMGLGPLDPAVGWLAHVYFERSAYRAADLIVTQNEEQSAACERLGLPHALIPSIVEPPPGLIETSVEEYDAVWVGNVGGDSRRSKGVDDLLRLIRALPDLRFAVVGGLIASYVSEEAEALRGLPNAAVLGWLAHDEVLDCIAKAKVTINTSPSEGFSNVMLEGWSMGKPSVTLHVDPSRLLSERGLGSCAMGDIDAMCSALRSLSTDDERRRAMGDKCRDYVQSQHAPEHVCELIETAIRTHASHQSERRRQGPPS
jgi:glycosyltransferase involved in cell wall biosynthesis